MPGAAPRRRLRTGLTVFLVLMSIALLLAGFWFGTREAYFVGTNSQGMITLFQGVPIDLPGDVALYTPVYTSTVPAAGLPARQRQAVLGHGLRSQGDATDLVRSLEQGPTQTTPEPDRPDGGNSNGQDSRGGSSGGQSSGGQRTDGAR